MEFVGDLAGDLVTYDAEAELERRGESGRREPIRYAREFEGDPVYDLLHVEDADEAPLI
jgi:hypothetical protein